MNFSLLTQAIGKEARLERQFKRQARVLSENFEKLTQANTLGQAANDAVVPPQSALEYWLSVDADLAMLHKQLIEARVQREKLAGMYSKDDPMFEMVQMNLESAESAFETRMRELKDDPELEREFEAFQHSQEEKSLRRQMKEQQKDTAWIWLLYFLLMLSTQQKKQAFEYKNQFNSRSLTAAS